MSRSSLKKEKRDIPVWLRLARARLPARFLLIDAQRDAQRAEIRDDMRRRERGVPLLAQDAQRARDPLWMSTNLDIHQHGLHRGDRGATGLHLFLNLMKTDSHPLPPFRQQCAPWPPVASTIPPAEPKPSVALYPCVQEAEGGIGLPTEERSEE